MKTEQGVVLVEFALLAPVLLLLLLGASELGIAGFLLNRMQNSAAAVAVHPEMAEQERERIGCDGTVTITEHDGLRLVAFRCASPLPFTSYLTDGELYAEAVAPLP